MTSSARITGWKRAPRRGFTLVELLVVIVILSMLMTLALGALYQSQEAARAAKTRSLINKINAVVMDKYESYRTRRKCPLTRACWRSER
jgi:prepilin-type N-terminal cleavage/methylation domain-containing protein